MNYLHLMKKVAIAILCVLSVASAQDKRFAFKGNAAQAGSSGISTATARQNTGWTSNGTTAQDTLATVYRLDKANVRFIVTDADGDTLWFYPQNLHPLILKDGTLLLSGVDSTGRGYFGGNAATAGQTRRAFLNVVGIGDTLLALIGDGDRAVGDSSAVFDQAGRLSIGGAQGSNLRKLAVVSGSNKASLDPTNLLFGTTTTDYSERMTRSGNSFDFYTNTVARFRIATNGYVAVGNNFASSDAAIQAFFTVRANGTADTLMMARNDKNSTLDSTMMVFANGDGYFGGNNLYQGGHRWRSNAAGDSLILYDGNTMIFAILSDGSTADLVATTPFWKFFDKFRNEVLFWILAVAGILVCILALLSIYAKVRMIRFGGYETLAENL